MPFGHMFRRRPHIHVCRSLNITHIVNDIQSVIEPDRLAGYAGMSEDDKETAIDDVARANVLKVMHSIPERSNTLRGLIADGRIAVAGALYDVSTGKAEFFGEITESTID